MSELKPTRRKTVRLPTAEIQEHSWIEYIPLNCGERFADNATVGLEEIKKHVVRWNLVNDDGEPIPNLEDDPEAWQQLNTFEFRGLLEIMRGFWGPRDVLKN